MEAFDLFGPKLAAMLTLAAVAYALVSLEPVWWPAVVVWKARPRVPRRWLFVAAVAALVYGVSSFLAFAVILPIQVYGIFVAPQLQEAGFAYGAPVLRVSSFLADYWWALIPPLKWLLRGTSRNI